MNTKKIKNNIETKKNLKQKHFLHSTFYILHSTDSGFTLIETLVSLLIFSVSIAAMIFVTSHGVADATYAKNKLVASYLAQEGIELVRYARDSDVLANKDTGWGQFVSDISLQYNCFQPLLCHADPESFAIESGNPPIYFDGDTFTGYNYSAVGDPTNFQPSITFEKLNNNNDKIQVTSTVTWSQGKSNYSVSTSEIVFNWPLL